MDPAVFLKAELPHLRRFARAVTGCRARGDELAGRLFTAASNAPEGPATRLALYRALDLLIAGSDAPEGAETSAAAHRALLLTDLEGFSATDAAAITGLSSAEIDGLIDSARSESLSADHVEVFIIEDEPLIAAHIAEITRQMGHTVIGTAATAQSARKACRAHPPGLLLSDVILGEEPAGADVAHEISTELGVPAIYVTAFPQTLLKGQPGEPAYLLEKPFRSAAVKTMIGRALLRNAGQASARSASSA